MGWSWRWCICQCLLQENTWSFEAASAIQMVRWAPSFGSPKPKPDPWVPQPPSKSQGLPIEEHRDAIVDCVQTNRVTCIQGDTGCGKSSMVPQYLWEADKTSRIIITQPRRIAAISLAKRVAEQIGAEGKQLVGYRLGQGERFEGLSCACGCSSPPSPRQSLEGQVCRDQPPPPFTSGSQHSWQGRRGGAGSRFGLICGSGGNC